MSQNTLILKNLYRGENPVAMAFQGDKLIFQGVEKYVETHNFITITNYENTDGVVTIAYGVGSRPSQNPHSLVIEVSTDGNTWESVTGTSTQSIVLTIPANGYLLIDGTKGGQWTEYEYYPQGDTLYLNGYYHIHCNVNHTLSGDIMNLTSAGGMDMSMFQYLFSNNVRLRSAEGLILSSSTLARSCYNGMFSGCTFLEYPPVLPAATLADYSYAYMFNQCARLKRLTCLATDISAYRCTRNWTQGITSTGTFYCDPDMTGIWQTGVDGVPTNWTITPYSE